MFDVKALFPSVPTDLALQCVEKVLDENPQMLQSSTLLDKNDILDLLKICLEAAVFKFNEDLFKQKHGTLMGFPISVVLAEFTM